MQLTLLSGENKFVFVSFLGMMKKIFVNGSAHIRIGDVSFFLLFFFYSRAIKSVPWPKPLQPTNSGLASMYKRGMDKCGQAGIHKRRYWPGRHAYVQHGWHG